MKKGDRVKLTGVIVSEQIMEGQRVIRVDGGHSDTDATLWVDADQLEPEGDDWDGVL